MSSQNQKHKPFLSGVLMQVVYGYKKHLAIIGIAAIILSAIFSGPYFITPLFESEVILYPTASNSISKVLLSDNFNSLNSILLIPYSLKLVETFNSCSNALNIEDCIRLENITPEIIERCKNLYIQDGTIL